MFVADQRRLRNEAAVLELVFDGLRRNQLAARGLEQFLLAVGDIQKAVRIEMRDIAGFEPAFRIETLGIRRRFMPVAGERPKGRAPAVRHPRQV